MVNRKNIVYTIATLLLIACCAPASDAANVVTRIAGLTTTGTTEYPNAGMRRVASIDVDQLRLSDGGRIGCGTIDTAGGYAYFITYSNPAYVIKVRLSDFTTVAYLQIQISQTYPYCAYPTCGVIDPVGGYLYLSGHYMAKCVIGRVRLSDFKEAGSLVFDSTINYATSAVIDPAGGYAYFGEGDFNACVVRVRLSDFTLAGTLQTNQHTFYAATIDTAGGYAYFLGANSNSVVRIRLADFTNAGMLALTSDHRGFRCAAIDALNGFAYFGNAPSTTAGPPASEVVKVRLSDFSQVGKLTLNPGEGLISAAIDPAAGYVYFATDDSTYGSVAPGNVIKLRLSDFRRVGTLPLNPGEHSPIGAVIDPANEVLYSGTFDSPAHILKVALGYKNSIQASRITVGESGKFSGARFYSHAAAGHLRLAIYNNGSPKKLVWQSGSIANAAAGWLTVSVSAGTPNPLFMASGTYWLAWQTDTNASLPGYHAATSADGFSVERPFGSFPATIDAPSITMRPAQWSEYISYTYSNTAAGDWASYR